MKIVHVKHNEVDRPKWDSCVEKAFNGIIYGYSWYLDVVAPGWEALVSEDYHMIMPLTFRKKYGINYIFPPPFTQQLGVFSIDKLTEDQVLKFLEAVPQKFKYAEINLNTFNKLPAQSGYIVKERRTHELDLIQSYEETVKGYSENTKRNIAKAEKAGCQLVADVNIDDLINLFKFNRGAEVNLPDRDYITLKNLLVFSVQKGKGVLAGTVLNNELCAAAAFVESNNKIIFLFSGLSENGREAGAMPFLIDGFIKSNSQKNLTLDFEGSDIASLARFYKSFGSKECVYLQVKINSLPPFLKLFKK